MTDIAGLISTIGFPIVAFLLMYKLSAETIKTLGEAVSENTKVLAELKMLIQELNQ